MQKDSNAFETMQRKIKAIEYKSISDLEEVQDSAEDKKEEISDSHLIFYTNPLCASKDLGDSKKLSEFRVVNEEMEVLEKEARELMIQRINLIKNNKYQAMKLKIMKMKKSLMSKKLREKRQELKEMQKKKGLGQKKGGEAEEPEEKPDTQYLQYPPSKDNI